jgi:hypothetical protein
MAPVRACHLRSAPTRARPASFARSVRHRHSNFLVRLGSSLSLAPLPARPAPLALPPTSRPLSAVPTVCPAGTRLRARSSASCALPVNRRRWHAKVRAPRAILAQRHPLQDRRTAHPARLARTCLHVAPSSVSPVKLVKNRESFRLRLHNSVFPLDRWNGPVQRYRLRLCQLLGWIRADS